MPKGHSWPSLSLVQEASHHHPADLGVEEELPLVALLGLVGGGHVLVRALPRLPLLPLQDLGGGGKV